MPEPESPRLRSDRYTILGATALVCLAMPSVAVLIADLPPETRRANVFWLIGTTLGGALLPFLYWAPYRTLGMVPLAAVAWLAAVGHGLYWHEWPGWAHGASLGLIVGACARSRRGEGPWEESSPLLAAGVVGVGAAAMVVTRGRPYDVPPWIALGVAVVLVGWSWARLLRPVLELLGEPVFWVMYRIRRAGPGFTDFPRTGPCIVIANHACWLDPLFLIKVIDRPITPMMIATFYDLPIVRPLMIRFGIIRVPDKLLKKDAPEIQEAIAALDRGECVVIFPEGYLRRTAEKPLRRFGQGVWQLLKARPGTPVFATWIEGGWGSYTSHANGPPTKNKRPDFRRPLNIGMSAAVAVAPEVLEDHLRARTYLMNLVGAARAHLGLDSLPPFELPAKADDAPDEPDA